MQQIKSLLAALSLSLSLSLSNSVAERGKLRRSIQKGTCACAEVRRAGVKRLHAAF